jgi:hypothetical protein
MSEEPTDPKLLNKKIGDFLIVNFILFVLYTFWGVILFLNVFILIPIFTGLITALSIFKYDKSIGQALGYAILFFLFLGIIGFSICVGSINIH